MSWRTVVWLFVAAITIHNAEEAVWLPPWSQKRGYWRIPATFYEARWVLAMLTGLVWFCAAGCTSGRSVWTYFTCGWALTMLLNVAVPHLIATIALRQYTPGTGTALALNLPTTSLLLRRAFMDGRISANVFAWAGPLVVLGILCLIPLLFLLIHRLPPRWAPRAH